MAQNFGRGNGIGSILRQTGREEGCRRTANVIRYGAKSRCRHRFCYGRDGSLVWLLLLLHKPEMTLRQIIYRDFLINIHHYLDWGSRKWVLTYIWGVRDVGDGSGWVCMWVLDKALVCKLQLVLEALFQSCFIGWV